MPPKQTTSKTGTRSSGSSRKTKSTSTPSTPNSPSASTEPAKHQEEDTESPPMSAPIASSPSEGPWLEALPAIVATLRSDVPLESLRELRTDLISMALLADHYVALVSHEGEQVEGVCTDKASQTGAHQYTKRCIFCGQTP